MSDRVTFACVSLFYDTFLFSTLIIVAIEIVMSLLTVILLLICTCTYVRAIIPSLLDKRMGKVGVQGTFWKCARIGERKSPYVAFSCLCMAFTILFWS